jgi:hypothetical protein
VTLYESPDAERVWAYSPGIVVAPNGDLVATIDLGGAGVAEMEGPVYERHFLGRTSYWQGRALVSVDGGKNWELTGRFPWMHARPFVAGESLYALGHAGDLKIARSDDQGRTWSEPVTLTEGEFWHQAPCNVWYANGCVYLVMEQRKTQDIQHWYVGELAPVLMRAKLGDDLTQREAWTFAEAPTFQQAVDLDRADLSGLPFYPYERMTGVVMAPHREMAPPGWLEANVVQFPDPGHFWHDPSGRTFHLWMRAHTGMTGRAAIAKVIEEEPGAGAIRFELETAPSGKTVLYVPCPGGQMKFHVLYDEQDGLYWLLSTQATDSMRRPDMMPEDRYGLPDNERRRLQLHYSRNMIDWIFAGMVAVGEVEQASRHYGSMAIVGDDLLVLSRSGDARAKNPHNGNLITLHRVEDFRALVDPAIRAAAVAVLR